MMASTEIDEALVKGVATPYAAQNGLAEACEPCLLGRRVLVRRLATHPQPKHPESP